jgi:hypothetical protein
MHNRAQKDLFADDSSVDDSSSLVAVGSRSAALTKAQQTFNRLVASIRRERDSLERWQAFTQRYRQRVAKEMTPLLAEMQASQTQMAFLIDEILSQPKIGKAPLSRRHRLHLQDVLVTLLQTLLSDTEASPELVAMHDRYSDVSSEELRRTELETTEAMLEEVLGEGVLGDHDATSVDELLRHAGEKVGEAARRFEAQREARAARPRSAKARQAEAQKAQAAKEASQSVREVYRKLASALHPDRETEVAERNRKTQLMQRVNQAYERNDLLALLGLQIEIEQIDAEHLAQVSDARLGHYNRVLKEQLAQLRAEIAMCIAPFQAMLDLPPWSAKPTPALVEQYLEADMTAVRAMLDELRQDLVAFKDPARLRARLEADLAQQRKNRDLGPTRDDFDELLHAMLASAPRPAKRGRRKRAR